MNNGVVYVCYHVLQANYTSYLYVKKFVSGSWTAVGNYINAPPGTLDGCTLAFNLTGNLLLADPYFDFGGATTLYQLNLNSWVKTAADTLFGRHAVLATNRKTGTIYLAGHRGGFDNNNPWVPVVIDTLSGSAWKPLGAPIWNTYNAPVDFALDPSGTPYYAHIDYPSFKVAVKKFTGSWVDVGLIGFSDGNASMVKIAFQGSTPIVAYRDASLAKAVVKSWNGVAWVSLGSAAVSPGDVNAISLTANSTTIWLGYDDATSGNKGTVKIRALP